MARFELFAQESRGRAATRLTALLKELEVDAPQFEARALLLGAANLSLAQLVLEPNAPLGETAARRLSAYAARRMAREPVTRILATRGFWTLDLNVAPDVLDPRADSETVIALSLRLFSMRKDAPLQILDLGSGSGALVCALLTEFPQASAVAVDLSRAACAATSANIAKCGLRERVLVMRGRWSEALGKDFDLIICNPPYVRFDEIALLAPEVRDYDPWLALDGGVDGLDAYRAIFSDMRRILKRDGIAVFEIGAGQEGSIAALAAKAGLRQIGVERDAAGHLRALAFAHAG